MDAIDDAIISELEKPSDEQDDMAHDSIISELEKPSNEQDDMAHGSEPLRKKMKSGEVLVETVEVAAPKTPEISAPKTPPIRHKTDPQSPWAQTKVVIPSQGDKKSHHHAKQAAARRRCCVENWRMEGMSGSG